MDVTSKNPKNRKEPEQSCKAQLTHFIDEEVEAGERNGCIQSLTNNDE
jgi:hypothetical protein